MTERGTKLENVNVEIISLEISVAYDHTGESEHVNLPQEIGKIGSLKTASPKTASLKTASLRPFAKRLIKFHKRI